MADISITASDVFKSANAQAKNGTAYEEITAGKPVGLATGNQIAKCNGERTCIGISLNHAYAGQLVSYVESDTALDLGISATGNVGKAVYVTATGMSFTYADMVSGDYAITAGTINTDGTLQLEIINGGIIP